MSNQIRVGDRTFTVLFPDLLRPLTPDERQGLQEDIRSQGVTCSVLVDEHDGVIDGTNRLQIAAELGLQDVPVRVLVGMTEEQKRQRAQAVNEHRRHLSPGELQELRQQRIIRVAEARRKGKSLRAIAAEEGISLGQVQQDLEKASAVYPYTPEPANGKVVGRDKKTYDAASGKKSSSPPSNGQPTAEPPNEEIPQEASEAVLQSFQGVPADQTVEAGPSAPAAAANSALSPEKDAWGIPVQEHAREAFAGAGAFDQIVKKLKECAGELNALADAPAGRHLLKRLQWVRMSNAAGGRFVLAELDNAIQIVSNAKPHVTDCPYAFNEFGNHPENCTLCHNARWLGNTKGHQIPPNLTNAMKAHYGIALEVER